VDLTTDRASWATREARNSRTPLHEAFPNVAGVSYCPLRTVPLNVLQNTPPFDGVDLSR